MKRILFIFGTRPEAIKMAPVIKALQNQPEKFNVEICVTAQHRQMLDQVLGLFEIVPNYDLNIMRPEQTLTDVTCKALQGLALVLSESLPDFVIVHGDTTTTMAASLAAFYAGIPVAHIEAGLRTRNKLAPFPEEINRRVTSCIADMHFAPTEQARQNLLREGIFDQSIYVVGNTVIDALLLSLNNIVANHLSSEIEQDLIVKFPSLINIFTNLSSQKENPKLILVTGHRRENFGGGFENICSAIKKIAETNANVQIVYPVHLNPNVQEPVKKILSECSNVHLIEPIGYLPFVYLMSRSYLVITDSGGIQEEAPSLGKPVLVTRDTTERPEAIEMGTLKLVGTSIEKIVSETQQILDDEAIYFAMSKKHDTYGDGKSSQRILEILSAI